MLGRTALLLLLLGVVADAVHGPPESLCAKCKDGEVCVVSEGEVKCINAADFNKEKHTLKEPHNVHASHMTHHSHGDQECSKDELNRLGGRLLKWFKDVHDVVPGEDRTLKLHTIACRPEVAWMFQQWDGNNDGHLTKAEMRPMERGGNEKCTEQLIDMCDDIDVNGVISVDEWCDCFSFSDDHVHEPPCHKAKHGADPHLLGVYIPRCDLEGFYKPEQCHDGACWCVDRFGREFDKSRVANQLPDCGQYASDMTEEDIATLKARL
ncbi:unnamed protein product [Caenorhabditis auriculariae]|uniref:Thyroglobulin type-1 domain-containing protein n=1 Tax=Caenorhabditis auriculariae TaxID=2777116 RepID=A0A8S1HFU2_9PELO|nr:unnamed protein product [Caenorhabditis auriculariae]